MEMIMIQKHSQVDSEMRHGMGLRWARDGLRIGWKWTPNMGLRMARRWG